MIDWWGGMCYEPAGCHAPIPSFKRFLHWSSCRRRTCNQRNCWSADSNPEASTRPHRKRTSVRSYCYSRVGNADERLCAVCTENQNETETETAFKLIPVVSSLCPLFLSSRVCRTNRISRLHPLGSPASPRTRPRSTVSAATPLHGPPVTRRRSSDFPGRNSHGRLVTPPPGKADFRLNRPYSTQH